MKPRRLHSNPVVGKMSVIGIFCQLDLGQSSPSAVCSVLESADANPTSSEKRYYVNHQAASVLRFADLSKSHDVA